MNVAGARLAKASRPPSEKDSSRASPMPVCNDSAAPAIPIAFYAGCASADTSGYNEKPTAAALVCTARRWLTADITAADGVRRDTYLSSSPSPTLWSCRCPRQSHWPTWRRSVS